MGVRSIFESVYLMDWVPAGDTVEGSISSLTAATCDWRSFRQLVIYYHSTVGILMRKNNLLYLYQQYCILMRKDPSFIIAGDEKVRSTRRRKNKTR